MEKIKIKERCVKVAWKTIVRPMSSSWLRIIGPLQTCYALPRKVIVRSLLHIRIYLLQELQDLEVIKNRECVTWFGRKPHQGLLKAWRFLREGLKQLLPTSSTVNP